MTPAPHGFSGVIFVLLGIGGVIYRINAVRLRSTLHLKAIQGLVDRIFHNAVPVGSSVILILGGAGFIQAQLRLGGGRVPLAGAHTA
jgi:hypothetical protein